MANLQRTQAVFGTTQWTLVGSLRSDDAKAAATAASLLMQRYWPAVYGYLRGRGINRHESAELTQAFFTDVVIGRRLFDRAEEHNGRLRNLILTALERFRIDQHRRAKVRGNGQTISSELLDVEERRHGLAPNADPGDRFVRRWAVAALEESLRRCEQHFHATGKAGHWRLFEMRVLTPASAGTSPPPLTDAASACGFADNACAAAAVQTVKKRALFLLREVVAETLEDPAALEDEVSLLQASLEVPA